MRNGNPHIAGRLALLTLECQFCNMVAGLKAIRYKLTANR